jgi:hypothetical protein
MKTVFDSSFKYTRSSETDVRKTFERIRRQQHAERRKQEQATHSDVALNVVRLDQMQEGIRSS